MSIKLQKIIMYIPLVNIITVFCLLGVYKKNVLETSRFIKFILLVFLLEFIITIPEIILSGVCDIIILNDIVHWITTYFNFFAYAFLAVREQEKILKEKEESKNQ